MVPFLAWRGGARKLSGFLPVCFFVSGGRLACRREKTIQNGAQPQPAFLRRPVAFLGLEAPGGDAFSGGEVIPKLLV